MKEVYTNVKYRDTVFRLLFNNKAHLLGLYNAVNNTDYADPNALEIVTLENAIYLGMKNDVSCLIDMRIQLYEHQSTVNPNMPLRDLMYVCEQYEKYMVNKDIYSSRLIKLPTPRFVVFYNGIREQPERRDLYLSDAFEIPEEHPSLELRVTQLNINKGYNEDLLKRCPTLFEYVEYVSVVRDYQTTQPLEEAVRHAVDHCIKHNILRDFLLANKAEVIRMTLYEYDEELHKQTIRKESYEDGEQNGKLLQLTELICRKLQKNKSPETIADELEEDLNTIQHIYAIAKDFAPDYDVAKIVEQYKQVSLPV
ncbi:MAG: hypothetical protein PUC55_00615 [Lachnospiraceae bacterium]|nr:hypothetical protein [Lachnospiraceae bacterium]HCJ08218.1 hypothetical protein [Lachnospiraceae bacterium]